MISANNNMVIMSHNHRQGSGSGCGVGAGVGAGAGSGAELSYQRLSDIVFFHISEH